MNAPRADRTAAAEGIVSRAVRIPPPSFRAVVREAAAPRTVWTAPDEAMVVGSGAAAALTASGPDRFRRIRETARALFAAGDVHAGTEAACPRLFGGFAFHDDPDGPPDDRDGTTAADHDRTDARSAWSRFPGARFVLPRVQVTDADNGTWLTVNAVGPDATPAAVEARLGRERDRLASLADPGPIADPPGVAARRRTTDIDDWHAGVNAAVERIRSGELRKVVLAQALECTLGSELSVADALARLGGTYPDCHRFLVEPDLSKGDPRGAQDGCAASEKRAKRDAPRTSFFGATPERLVGLRGRTVETGALAGTTGRGETPAEDEWLAAELRNSEKDIHEHELVAETIREQLAPFAAAVSTGERRIRRLATVQHLWTPITAELDRDEHVLSLVEALHPTPAVGGLPPELAMETIRETEPFDRGWYAAPVGWFDAAGNGTFAVALRSAVASGRTATLFAGVGIVADSDPDREWDEVQLKYRPILDELERQ
ncbi:isochorismate synthase [Halegenticoccus tardaugens]|uniref:isochorismate synthase n=1 Tax=Halegenticoccus tardaugens TaxID=2071624 RepID=UPI00100B01A9|nr:isochorismate synthase [Halegenticoccus tardaugens]